MLFPMQEIVRILLGAEFPKHRYLLVQREEIYSETGNVLQPLSYPSFFIFCPYGKDNWPGSQRILQNSKGTISENINEHCQNVPDEFENAALKAMPNNWNRRKKKQIQTDRQKILVERAMWNSCGRKKLKKENTKENTVDYRIKRNKAKAIITKTKKKKRNLLEKVHKGHKHQHNLIQVWNQINSKRGIKSQRTTYHQRIKEQKK